MEAMKPGPNRKVQFRLVTSACPVVRQGRGVRGRGAGEVLPEGDDGEQGDDADEDDRRLPPCVT